MVLYQIRAWIPLCGCNDDRLNPSWLLYCARTRSNATKAIAPDPLPHLKVLGMLQSYQISLRFTLKKFKRYFRVPQLCLCLLHRTCIITHTRCWYHMILLLTRLRLLLPVFHCIVSASNNVIAPAPASALLRNVDWYNPYCQ